MSTIAFDSAESMAATRDASDRYRTLGADELGIEYLDVAEFDVVLARLGLPEVS